MMLVVRKLVCLGRYRPRRLRGAFRIGHPFPAFLAAVVGTASFLIAQRRLGISAHALLLFVSIWLVNYSVNSMVDCCDEILDRSALRQEKPLIAGDLSLTAAQLLCVAAAALGFLLSYQISAATVCIALLFWLAGVAYNLWAKSSVVSWLPYAIGLPSIPVWGFVAANRVTAALLLTYPLGLLLALGWDIANTLRDLDRDMKGGVVGMTHRLGRTRALAVLWVSFGTTIIVLPLVASPMGNEVRILIPSTILAAILLGIMIADWFLFRSPASLQRSWYLGAICGAVVGCGWVASLP